MSSLPPPPPSDSSLDPLSSLLSSGAAFDPLIVVRDAPVRRLRSVAYGADPFQQLDIYFPGGHVASSPSLPAPPAFPTPPPAAPLPVLVHIHGGGWARGGKSTWAHGAPSICKAAAAQGLIAVSVGYRRGEYPNFVDDAAMALRWVRDHIAALGGDLNNVFLSGHSAGAHIASLMVVSHARYLAPHNIPPSFIKGLTLISGIYNLFAPLEKALFDMKNKGFVLLYVFPSFGSDRTVRREASPLILLDPTGTDTSLAGRAAMATPAGWHPPSILSWRADPFEIQKERQRNVDVADRIEVNKSSLPPCLVMNCQFDLGLGGDGKKMAAALSKHTEAEYVCVPMADHGSVCRSDATHDKMVSFMLKQYNRDLKPS